MDRYMKSVQRGKATATPELVKLWGSEAGSDRVANSVDLDFVCTGCPL